ncbi:MAG: mechanosensitive ion channel family protein [Chloroflexota bacterium]|nr:mechanosensitive ion channel family protein [Chloroflexota bacterium]
MPAITVTALVSWLQTNGLRIVLIVVGALLLRRVLTGALARFERTVQAAGNNDQAERQKRARTLASVLRSLGLVAIVVAASLMVLAELGVDIAPLLAGAGILGLALGLGAQSLVRDLMGGFFILVEEQFHVGDVVAIGAITGTVERMTLRATYLRDLDGSLHLIPNGEVRIVSNLTRGWSRAVVDVTVPSQSDTGQLIALLEDVCRLAAADTSLAALFPEPPTVLGVEALDAATIRLRLMAKTPPGKQWEVARLLRLRIKEQLDAEGISETLPRQVIAVSDTGAKKSP